MPVLATDRVLTPDQLRMLSRRSDARGAARLVVHLGLLGITGWMVAVAGPLGLLPAMLALGVVQAALFAPAHETMHRTAFASRRANAVVGWLAAAPSLLNAQFYACFHLAHHRHTQREGDPELGVMPDPRTRGEYLARVSGLLYWRLRLRVLGQCWRGDLSSHPYISAAAAPGVIASVRAMSLLLAVGALGGAALFGWATPLLFWIGPQLLGQPLLRLYLLAEHTGCTRDANGLTNTRTTLTNAAMRLLMWDMPFHAEHHLYPSIPFHRLAAAHRAIRERLGCLQHGYVRWNLGFYRAVVGRAGAAIR